MNRWAITLRGLILSLLLFVAVEAFAKGDVVIILDDMGNKRSDLQALSLPASVTFSILPGTPFANRIALKAQQQGRDVMLHLPMQADEALALGPMAITSHMSSQAVATTLEQAFSSVPFVVGVNNHMGSLLTRDPVAMQRVMSLLRPYKVFFIDSRTSADSIAAKAARQHNIPTATRHLFLDHFPNRAFIEHQWRLLEKLAMTQPLTVVIAHPHKVTLAFLREHLLTPQPLSMSLISASHAFETESNMHALQEDASLSSDHIITSPQ